MSTKHTLPTPTQTDTPVLHTRIPKALTLALWLTSISLLAIAACTIYAVVLAQDFIDITDSRLKALGNNTLGIYAALAGDEYLLNNFVGHMIGSVDAEDAVSMRRALYLIMDEIRDANAGV